jgi:hypothetical protein
MRRHKSSFADPDPSNLFMHPNKDLAFKSQILKAKVTVCLSRTCENRQRNAHNAMKIEVKTSVADP